MGRHRDEQRSRTRERLADEALGLFEAKGYAASTVDDIAAAAGTTRSTFYQHYSSKADLMRSLIGRADALLITRDDSPLAALIEAGEPAEIEKWLAHKVDQWPQIRAVVQAAHQAAGIDLDIQQSIDVWFASVIGEVEAGLERAGRFLPASRRVRATLAFGELEFASMRWMRHGWDADFDRDRTLALLAASWCALLVG